MQASGLPTCLYTKSTGKQIISLEKSNVGELNGQCIWINKSNSITEYEPNFVIQY